MFRYKRENGVVVIEMKLQSVQQLFDTKDPSPFPARDIDPEAISYILSSAREFSLSTPLKLRIILPVQQADNANVDTIAGAIHNHFSYEAELRSREIRQILSNSRSAFFVGIIFLVTCIFASHELQNRFSGIWSNLFSEGLNILGWVAMWQPLDMFLYSWRPIAKIRKFHLKLTNIDVELNFQ